jgi:hypothetical protein
MTPSRNTTIIIALIIIGMLSSTGFARIRHVPGEYGTIQGGIDDCSGGDTLLVDPGEYHERLSFNGQYLVLASQFLLTRDYSYIQSTIIDADSMGSVLTFNHGEGPNSLVCGFTIRRGKYEDGGGFYCDGASPTIAYNIIRNNTARRGSGGGNGGGIFVVNSNAIILNNLVLYNITSGVYGGFGGGIAVRNNSSPILINNTVTRNTSNQLGGGMFTAYASPVVTNMIFWNNDAVEDGDELYIFESNMTMTYCDVYAGYPGEGNINANPEFRNVGSDDFHLMSTEYGYAYDSPCIDVGNPAIEDSTLDSLWGLGTVASDMGAFGGGDSTGVGIYDEIQDIPNKISLSQNYPNPFNPSTAIDFVLAETGHVSLKVFNLLGQEMMTLVDDELAPGPHSINFDGRGLSSGVYYYTLQTDNQIESKSMILIK